MREKGVASGAHVKLADAHGTGAERNSNLYSVVPADGAEGTAASERRETSVDPRFMSSYVARCDYYGVAQRKIQ
jgi:hypothetical protein